MPGGRFRRQEEPSDGTVLGEQVADCGGPHEGGDPGEVEDAGFGDETLGVGKLGGGGEVVRVLAFYWRRFGGGVGGVFLQGMMVVGCVCVGALETCGGVAVVFGVC